MRIQHNIMAMNANRNLTSNNTALSKNLEKLSSGYKINRAGDDAAGLAISEKMRADIAIYDQSINNANDGISLIQTAEGALTEVHDMLNRLETLATQAATDTYDQTARDNIQLEVKQLMEEIDRINADTKFNDVNLFGGGGATTTFDLSGKTWGTNDKVEITLSDGTKKTYTYDANSGDGKFKDNTDLVDKINADSETHGWTAKLDGDKIVFTETSSGSAGLADGATSSGITVTADGNNVTETDFDNGQSSSGDATKATHVFANISGNGKTGDTFVIGGVTYSYASTTNTGNKKFKDAQGLVDCINANTATTNWKAELKGTDVVVTYEGTGEPTTSTSAITGKFNGTSVTSTYTPYSEGTGGGGGGGTGSFTFQISETSTLKADIQATDSATIGISTINLTTRDKAAEAISEIKEAVTKVSKNRANLGAWQNRLEHTVNNLGVTKENLQNAESTIRDTNVADEMMEYTKNNILIQSAQAMLAQANQVPQGVLQLMQ